MKPAVIHLGLGVRGGNVSMSACGLLGLAHRPVQWTRDWDKATCRRCRAWMDTVSKDWDA
jgi:hypothetical protein